MKTTGTPPTVHLTINGRPVTAAPGETILEAARHLGIEIPTLCQHEWVSPIGSCRLCVVKVEGINGTVASCTTPVTEGMKVSTDDDELLRLRRQQIQYILLNHPLDCPVCDKAGECRLQDLTYSLGVAHQAFQASFPEPQRIDTQSRLIERNDQRCVRCGRCVSVCHEVMAVGAYRFTGRGYASRIDTNDGGPLDCEFCGQCVAICPVGALLSKPFKHRARVWDLRPVETVCGYCGAGCQLELNVRGQRVHRVTSNRRQTSNRGLLCVRGSFGYDTVHSADRATEPRVRREGKPMVVDRSEALESALEGLRRATATGADAVGVLISARLPMEDVYLAARVFHDVFGTTNIALTGQDGYVGAWRTVRNRLGRGGSTATFDDLLRADAIVLVGADLAAEMPVPHLNVLAAVREHDARLICAHSLPTKLDDFASVRLRYRPGEETAALLMLARALADAKGQNLDFVIKHTEGFAAFKSGLDRLEMHSLLQRTGLEWDEVRKAATQLAAAKRPLIVLGQQALAGSAEANTNLALDLLAMVGHLENSLLLCGDRGNTWGALLATEAAGVSPLSYRGVLAAGLDGKLSAMVILGGDPLVSSLQAESLRKAMEVTGFVIVADSFFNTTAEGANVFFPTTVLAERGGHVVSAEGRLLRLQRAVDPLEGTTEEWLLLAEFARRWGQPLGDESLTAIWQELLSRNSELAACHARVTSQQGVLLTSFAQKLDIRVAFGSVPRLAEPLAGDLILVAGPTLAHNGTLSLRSTGPRQIRPEPWLALHPADAGRRQIADGETVRVQGEGLSLPVVVHYDARLSPGTAFAPVHFPSFPVARMLNNGACVSVTINK